MSDELNIQGGTTTVVENPTVEKPAKKPRKESREQIGTKDFFKVFVGAKCNLAKMDGFLGKKIDGWKAGDSRQRIRQLFYPLGPADDKGNRPTNEKAIKRREVFIGSLTKKNAEFAKMANGVIEECMVNKKKGKGELSMDDIVASLDFELELDEMELV